MRRLICIYGVSLAFGADWTRFRGPNGSGVMETAGLPDRFGPAANVVWRAPLPAGHSSPIVEGDRIFLTGVEEERLVTIALDRASGKVLWKRECLRERKESLDKRNHPASPTPAVDRGNVFVFFPDAGLVSYTRDGKERWRTPLGPFNNIYGMGASPIVVDDRVVLICDQSSGSFAMAVGAADGRIRWKTSRPEALSGHSTPIIYRPKQGSAQIIAPGSFRMDAYSVETGESVWWVNGLASEMKSVPVLAGETIYINGYNTPENDPGKQIAIDAFDDVAAKADANKDGKLTRAEVPDERTRRYFPFIDLNRDGSMDAAEWKIYRMTMAAENGILAIQAGGHGDRTLSGVRWKYQRAVPQLPSALFYRGIVYMINDTGVLTTLDAATGAVHKQARLRGTSDIYYASPVAGDGKLYVASHSGVVSVLKAGGEQELLVANDLGDEIYATPAIADGFLYVRTRSAIYCFGSSRN